MDPDAALAELLTLMAPLLDPDRTTEAAPTQAELSRVAELIDALDGWLAAGGFLPRRWADRCGTRTIPSSTDPRG